ncbi:glycosyltransferase family 39 protein [Marinicella sp. S1101]|uniref:glycosyltransferase family 39 protein n=1 Tax=Marinicella marina TaxID=2996016 RepID=UPI002260F5F1|nr:glycosyltransferase family 39 protein [Marinicella marina]MCX7552944.1 glycosyltransferase family 39 protein [Marinicella marina]MDJ1139746.1 glycosyltransferase family 39 protein [Marinicella marina]
MLKQASEKHVFLSCFTILSLFQVVLAASSELFVDEAFYWLEGQHLAWSYSEVPGFLPWTLALNEWLLPHHPFWLRLPGLLALFSVPWLGMILAKQISTNHQKPWSTGMLLLALPLLGISGTLAVADIWMVFFSLLSLLIWHRACQNQKPIYFLLLGLVLAVGINTHLRFWLIVMISCLVIFWVYRTDKESIFALLKLTFPVMLLGFFPILIFNLSQDFPLLAFQLKDRHPWAFQASHFKFFVLQIIITTPLVFWLCLRTAALLSSKFGKLDRPVRVLALIASVHWLVYAILGFYSDSLRLNLHWTLISYVLLLIVASTQLGQHNQKIFRWGVITGTAAHLGLLTTLIYWQNLQDPKSQLNAQVTQNAIGWQQVSTYTDEVLNQHQASQVIADNFMTLAQLRYYSDQQNIITVLPHPLNSKHGRDLQLKIMELMHQPTDNSSLLVVEHSALKLQQQIPFYQQTCAQLGGMKLVDSLDLFAGIKTFHFFITGQGECQMPPIIYHEKNAEKISGWVLQAKNHISQLEYLDPKGGSQQPVETSQSALGSNELFKSLPQSDSYQLIHFTFDDTNPPNRPLQLLINIEGKQIRSARLN